MSFSENVKKFRIEKGLTQEQLAVILSVSPQAVSKWERSDSYPDCALLVPLSNVLEASLDQLFDQETVYKPDLSEKIIRLLQKTEKKEQFELVRELCWQIEKGLFGAWKVEEDECFADDLKKNHNSSSVCNDYGFTQISNGQAPFFSVFPEPETGWGQIIGDGEEMRQIFAYLSSRATMRAVLFLYHEDANFIFEGAFLAQKLGLNEEELEKTLADLEALRVIQPKNSCIDGKTVTLYYTHPSHTMIALLLFAKELNYCGAYSLQSDHRNQHPFL